MARKIVLVSDLSGADIPDGEQVELRVLEFPELSQPVKLDASKADADKLRRKAVPFALLEIVDSEGHTERIVIAAEALSGAIRGDAHQVMAQAEAVHQAPAAVPPAPTRRGRRPRGEAAAPREGKADYPAANRLGQLHRGHLNEAEMRLVRRQPRASQPQPRGTRISAYRLG